jgi:hypothetical protein
MKPAISVAMRCKPYGNARRWQPAQALPGDIFKTIGRGIWRQLSLGKPLLNAMQPKAQERSNGNIGQVL